MQFSDKHKTLVEYVVGDFLAFSRDAISEFYISIRGGKNEAVGIPQSANTLFPLQLGVNSRAGSAH